jgi:hypothetical protein
MMSVVPSLRTQIRRTPEIQIAIRQSEDSEDVFISLNNWRKIGLLSVFLDHGKVQSSANMQYFISRRTMLLQRSIFQKQRIYQSGSGLRETRDYQAMDFRQKIYSSRRTTCFASKMNKSTTFYSKCI